MITTPITRPITSKIASAIAGARQVGASYDYYVDSVSGSDENDGAKASTAFATLAAAAALAGEGKKIGLACGSHWREQLTLSADNITVSSYGEGVLPVIDASEVITTGGMSVYSGNTYQASAVITDSVTNFVGVWEDGVHLVRAANAASVGPGEYFPSADTGTPITIYFQASDSSDPTTNGKVYEFTSRQHAIHAEARVGTRLNGVIAKRNLNHNGSIFLGKNSIVSNCQANEGNKHNLFVRGGSVVSDTTVSDAYYGGTSLSLVAVYEAVATGGSITFTDCVLSTDSHIEASSGILAHVGSGSFGAATITRCTVRNVGTAFNFSSAVPLVNYIDCETDDCTSGIAIQSSEVNISGGHFDARTTCLSGVAHSTAVEAVGTTFEATGSAANIIRALSKNLQSFSLQNCTIVDARGWMFQITSTNTTIDLQGNDYGTVGFGYYDIQQATTLALMTSDNNTFASSTSDFRMANTTYTDFSAYRAAYPALDAGSTTG